MAESVNRLLPGKNLTAELLGLTRRPSIGDEDTVGQSCDKSVSVKGHLSIRAVAVLRER